jgi:hypothetical protein
MRSDGICRVVRDGDPDRYQCAAVRWLERFALEARDVTIEDLRLAVEALDALRDRTAGGDGAPPGPVSRPRSR